ncbi:MAG: DNA alkylation repair protein, partial [Pyrinomonadaceae bacterium]|nr:DNA alkylation repair protein [Pyrinomonadaceae bacterium]
GIGWAAKTTAKFHPDIVADYRDRMEADPNIKQWFKTKIEMGLSNSEKYASRYTK